jgi:hypothetical protein
MAQAPRPLSEPLRTLPGHENLPVISLFSGVALRYRTLLYEALNCPSFAQ